MKNLICVVVCAAFVCGTPWMVRAEEEMFAEEVRVSRNTAVMLSVLFPGLGQMATGQQQKGGAFFLTGLAALVAAVDRHEEYNTLLEVYETSWKEYDALRNGGSHREAEAKWERLVDLNDDLDRLHGRRRIFAYAMAGIYVLNVVDILRSGDAAAAKKVHHRPGLSVGFVGGTAGIVVSKQF